jgi:hypothetical protein
MEGRRGFGLDSFFGGVGIVGSEGGARAFVAGVGAVFLSFLITGIGGASVNSIGLPNRVQEFNSISNTALSGNPLGRVGIDPLCASFT